MHFGSFKDGIRRIATGTGSTRTACGSVRSTILAGGSGSISLTRNWRAGRSPVREWSDQVPTGWTTGRTGKSLTLPVGPKASFRHLRPSGHSLSRTARPTHGHREHSRATRSRRWRFVPLALFAPARRAIEDQQRASQSEDLWAVSKDKNERIHALRLARSRGDASYLREALSDPDTRTFAARYLADIDATEAIPAVTRLLFVADARTRSAAIKALTKLGAEDVLPDLVAIATTDPSPVVRSHAIGAIRRLGNPDDVVPVLLQALQDPDGGVSVCAAEELGWVAGPAAIEPIQAAAVGAHFLRRGGYRKAIRRIRARSRHRPDAC